MLVRSALGSGPEVDGAHLECSSVELTLAPRPASPKGVEAPETLWAFEDSHRFGSTASA